MEKLLNVAKVAKQLSLAEGTVRRYERLGVIPSVRIGAAVRFREEEIDIFMKSGALKSKEKAPTPEPESTEFFTRDMWEAAVLIVSGFAVLRAERMAPPNQYGFVFDNDSGIKSTLDAHRFGTLNVSSRDFVDAYQIVKRALKDATS